MKDKYGRIIKYLRLSVTDLCNCRCIYCMPEQGVRKKSHADILTIEELTGIAQAAYSLGITKIRLTGGEPLVRRGIITLCRNIRDISPDIELGMTTNGSLLPSMAAQLKDAGLDRLNISLDTLDREAYKRITRGGSLDDVLDGIKAAQEAGFRNIKLNCVIIGGVNDSAVSDMIQLTGENDVQVRFIELMPIGVAKGWDKSRFISLSSLENYLKNTAQMHLDGVARVYRLSGHKGTVGLISPISDSFCPRCDKIRVTADGRLKPCLHSDTEINLKGLSGEELKKAIISGIELKPQGHSLSLGGTGTVRCMNEIGG